MIYASIGISIEGESIDIEHIKKKVIEDITSGKPIIPIVFLENLDGVTAIPVMYENDTEKNIFFKEFLPTVVETIKATRITAIQEVWFYRSTEEDETIKPNKHPDRQSGIYIFTITNDEQYGTLIIFEKNKVKEIYETGKNDNSRISANLYKECKRALKNVARELPR